MLSVERTCLHSSTTSDHQECVGKMKNAENKEGSTQNSTRDATILEENKVATLERQIEFLRAQHEIMLRSLHEEIENLRKSNKALQFRLVMCSCSSSCSVQNDTNSFNSQASQLECEIENLKKLLDEERYRNQSLISQMETMQLARSIVSEQIDLKNTAVCVAQQDMKQCSVEHITKPSSANASGKLVRGSGAHEHLELSNSDTITAPFSLHNPGHSQVASPDLKSEGSSSAFMITPHTAFNAMNGTWARHPVSSVTDIVSVHSPSYRPPVRQQNCLSGSHAVPAKLPALRNGKSHTPASLVQAVSQTAASFRVSENGGHHLQSTSYKPSSILSNESSQVKAARSARTNLGNNSIAVFDPVAEFSGSYPVDVRRTSDRPYTGNLGPFLPALPKTGDAGQAARQRKARLFQRKRLDRTQNMFPP